MPSPDVRPYVDLTLLDRDAQEIFDTAIADAEVKFPDWTPIEGNTEVVLLESLSLTVEELIFAINRLPGAITEVLLGLYGLDRSAGLAPTTTIRFHLADNLGHEIPGGTTVRLLVGPELVPLDFETDVGLVVPAGQVSGVVAATATRPTPDANGTAAGTAVTLIDAIAYVNNATLETAVVGGTLPESGEAFLDRGVQLLRRLVTTLVIPEHFTAAALENAAVVRATSIDNFDPGQAGNPGDHPGHITVVVAGAGGAALTQPTKDAIDADLEAKAQANLAVHIANPTVTAVAVDVTVRRLAGFTDAQVIANVTEALQGYLDPETWPWSATVRRNELIALVDGAEGVDYVAALTAPAADVALAGIGPLADAGAINVVVQAP